MAKVAIQGGVKNYLGNQKTVGNVPLKWQSGPDAPDTELAYITKAEKNLLLKKDLHGSLKNGPNTGPAGIMSLDSQGSGFGGPGPGKGGDGPGPQGDFRSNAQHTGLKADYSRDRTVTGDTSAFRDSGTGRYNLSTKAKDQQAVNDYVQGKMGYQGGKKPSFFGNPFQSMAVRNNIYQRRANVNLAQKRAFQKYRDIEKYADLMDDYGLSAEDLAKEVAANNTYGYDFSDLDLGKKTLGSNIGTSIEKYRENLYDVNPKTSYSAVQAVLNKTRKDTQVTAENTLNKARAYNKAVDAVDIKGEIDRLGNLGNSNLSGQITRDGDGPRPYLPIDYNTGAATVEAVEPYTNDFTYRFGDKQNVGADVLRGYVANGGRITRAGGGIMNAVPRQGYGFGSIVKSITKPFKSVAKAAGKVLKSDVGKMALLAAGAYYAPAMFGGTTGFGAGSTYGNFARGLMSPNLIGPMTKAGSLGRTISNFAINNKALTAGILGLGGAALFGREAPPNEDIGMGDRGGSLIDPITGQPAKPAEMRASLNNAIENADGDPDRIAAIEKAYAFLPPIQELGQYYPYQTYGAANGGRIGYGLGNLVKGSGVAQPVSASMNAGDKPIMSRSGMGGMLSKLINNNSHLFKNAQNNNNYLSTAQNVGADVTRGSYDFIDENMNGIDDREETFMAKGGRIGFDNGNIVPPVKMPDRMEEMLKNMTPEERAKFQMMLKINAARMPEYKPDPNAIPPIEMPTYPRTNRAEGGLMNLGGMEKDYRAEGGFVPIGKQEKADDVPARLSVNEFVFTADAVRNAGQGDIDKGAEVMENMMKNLENGGRVSEESQGNTGAQNMFSVSERIGEVI